MKNGQDQISGSRGAGSGAGMVAGWAGADRRAFIADNKRDDWRCQMICALKAVVGWAILLVVGTNLVGFFVRGLVQQRQLKEAAKPIDEIAPEIVRRDLRTNLVLNVLSGVVCVVYLYLLFRWLGWPVAAAGSILMLARLPDLLFELRTGQKLHAANMPKRPIDIFDTILIWLALPLLWWGICRG